MNGGFIFLIILVIILSLCGIVILFPKLFKSIKQSKLSQKESIINRLDEEYYEKYGTHIPENTKRNYYNMAVSDLQRISI